jgi:Tautomerase enzyme
MAERTATPPSYQEYAALLMPIIPARASAGCARLQRQTDTPSWPPFYQLLAEKLEKRCEISPSDLVVSLIINKDEDWSFGFGKAQFLTGEL